MGATRDDTDGWAASTRPGRLPRFAPQTKDGLPMEPSGLFPEFVQQRDLLYGYILALTRDPNLADDILQDVGMSILTEAKRGTSPDAFIPWARGVARHRVADHYRRQATRRRHETHFDQFADAVDRAFAEHAPAAEEHRHQLTLLRECLEGLTARVRTIIDLRYSGRRSIGEIAAALSWTPGSIKVALSRARRALADCVRRKLRQEEAPG